MSLKNESQNSTISKSEATSLYARIKQWIEDESTFFRLHLLAFIFIPLICSIIYYECNGRYHISFIDSLFLCYSAMTVTGLSTVDLSTTTAWQQAILYLLMLIGDMTFVSWIMVLVRKNYFRDRCEYVASTQLSRSRSIFKSISGPTGMRPLHQPVPPKPEVEVPGPILKATTIHSRTEREKSPLRGRAMIHSDSPFSGSEAHSYTSSPRGTSVDLPQEGQLEQPHGVEFAMSTSVTPSAYQRRLTTIRESIPMNQRTLTILSNITAARDSVPGAVPSADDPKYRGIGSFPGPITLANRFLKRAAPGMHKTLTRQLTVPYCQTISGTIVPDNQSADGWANWLDFSGLIVGRNSDFKTGELTDEQLGNIGGVEYKALRMLSYIVPLYLVFTQLFSFILFAPWLSATTKYDNVFASQPRLVQKPWFSLFQVMGAYTGGGLSLVDEGMVPFQTAYLMIFALMFAILAGNHALPIFLRLLIWTYSKFVKRESDEHKALSFLLDHPRRCFIYLFPSHQTWFLVICLIMFSIIEWVSFEVLDLGLPAYNALSVGPRIVAGLFQGLAARASGISIVPLASMAPSLQFLYVVMMYIAVYPVAMSIRSTNVYEERSLGVFEIPAEDESAEPTDFGGLAPRQRLGRYLGWHLRRQMSMDIWWLVWAVFFIAIIERANLLDDHLKWFDLFRVLFELVSAFGGIGLSLGLPSDNFSFSGALKPLSKLVIIVIMVRGRHRGLPVAIDRAILLPSELVPQNKQDMPAATSPPVERHTFKA